MKTLFIRSLTGAFFATLVIGSIIVSPLIHGITFGIFTVIGLYEFYKLFDGHESVQVNKFPGVLIGFILYTILILTSHQILKFNLSVLLAPVIMLFMLHELWKKSKEPIQNIAIVIFSYFYIVFPMWLAVKLNYDFPNSNFNIVIGLFLLIWTNDTFAYLTGWIFGRTKLFERISPKKTWEGTIGGFLFTILIGYLIGSLFQPGTSYFWIIAAIIIAPCAIFGDLLESLFKRSRDLKDTGNILPGHGGVLDRFDAAFYAIPFFYAWVIVFNSI